MFGSDFNMALLEEANIDYAKLQTNAFREETMKALQEK